MANDKPLIKKMNTPIAVAKYPKLSEPDFGTNDFPKPEGEYSTRLIFQETDPAFVKLQNELQPYMDAVEVMAEEEFKNLKKAQRDKLGAPKMNPMFTPIYDDNDEPTGEVEMKFSMKASGVVKKGPRAGKKWSRKPQLFDSLGRTIKKPIDIWGGSELIIGFSFREDGYFIPATGNYGVKLQLEAAQIITLRQGGERSAEDYGFKARDGGFNADDLPEPEGDGDAGEDEFDENHTPAGGGGDPEGASDF